MAQRRPTLPTTYDYESPCESVDEEDSPIPKAPQWASSPVRQRQVLHHRHVGGAATKRPLEEPTRRDAVLRYKRKRKRYGFSRWIRTCLLAGIPAYLLLIFLFLKRLNERNAPLEHQQPMAAAHSWRMMQRELLTNLEQRSQRDAMELEKVKDRQQRRDGSILQRRSRTRPPDAIASSSPPLLVGKSMETSFASDDTIRPGLSRNAKVEELCGAEAKSVATTTMHFQARDALQMPKARIPRVLVTGILSRPAFVLALALHQQCGVEVVIGIDSMYPNSLRHRLELQEHMAILTKTIPKFSKPIMLSYIGLDAKKQPKNVKILESTREIDLVKSFSPTHIVHFASYEDDAFVEQKDGPNVYKLRNGLVSMEQILESVSLAPLNDRPHILYASASYSWERKMDELMANFYFKEHGVFSVGMRLPNAIYGPWGSPRSVLNQVFSGNTTQSLDLEELDLLHTDDLVNALIAAMQFRQSQPAVFDIESAGTRITGQQLRDIVGKVLDPAVTDAVPFVASNRGSSVEIQEALGWSPKVLIESGIVRTVAWHRDHEFPFGDGSETGDSILQRKDLETCAPDDITCHAGRPFLPCSSECSIHAQCQSTIFDVLTPVVKEVTEECDYVLYTQNFDKETKSLDISSEYIDDADPVICNVAFINQNSRLVDAVIAKVPDEELGKLGISMDPTTAAPQAMQNHKYEKLNGRLLYRGWILLWTDVPDERPIYEESLLKLSPGKIFHNNVKAAVYIDQRFSVSPTYNDILFLTQELHRKAWSSRVLKRKTRPKAKFLLPSEPVRHAVVLVSELNFQDSSKSKPLDPGVRISAYEATRFMRHSNGEEPLGREPPEIKLQREFYDRLRASINPDHGRHPDEPVHKFELKHWAKTSWVVHDLTLEESRRFRCEWYQEHILWGSSLDQLSFAYVMEKTEFDRKLEHNEPDESVQKHLAESTAVKKIMSDTFEWFALKTEQNKLYMPFSEMKMLPYEMDSADDRTMKSFDDNSPAQLFVRIMSDRVMKLARKAWTSKGRDTHPANLQDEL